MVKKTFTLTNPWSGDTEKVWLSKQTYAADNSLHIQMWCSDGPYATLTVCLPKEKSAGEEYAFVDTNNCPWAEEFIRENGLGAPMGVYGHSGWCTYPLYHFFVGKF